MFGMNEEDFIPHPDFSHMQVLSYLGHPATANVLRHYLENYGVQHTESNSILELFSDINHLDANENTWLIVDHSGDTEALLREIRHRYRGHLAVYGYQMQLEPNLLSEYQARALYQPLSRSALIQLLNNQEILLEEEFEQFNGQGLHVLAVDDHLPNLIVLEALLAELNVKMTRALSGQEALGILEAQMQSTQASFDLVFMDIQMPVMSGIDTTRAIRSLESTIENHKRLPIIALTAHALADEKHKLLKSGMDDYVTKPIQIEQIIQILTQWTKQNFNNKSLVLDHIATTTSIDPEILNWQQSLQLAANKEDLALDLLKMLVESFDKELNEMQELIEVEDFPQLEHVLHRLYGATRYVGTPQLQQVTGDFEQFVSILRKEQRIADAAFIDSSLVRFSSLKQAITEVRQAAQQMFKNQLD
jgi:two-component system sensor histidine kinase BarA